MAENGREPEGRRVRLYRDGSGQVLHIPRDLELDSAEAIVRRDGDRILVQAAGPIERRESLADVLASLEPLDDEDDFDFGELEEPVVAPVNP